MGRNKVTRSVRDSNQRRKDRSRKRKQPFNPKTPEIDEKSFSASAKKIRRQKEVIVPQDDSTQYRIINFVTVFAAISNLVKCRECNGNLKFTPDSTRGLGFKIAVICDNCPIVSIPSCSFIGHTYEINRRFIFAMRLLGLGHEGCVKLCGLLDMPSFLAKKTYNILAKQILGLTVYYGLAIRRHNQSVPCMKNAIWATYHHYNYDHKLCPVGSDSWCSWQRAAVNKNFDLFQHGYVKLPDDVSKAIKPIYTDLTKEELLERCVGGFTQNNNESYNQLIWKICPKTLPGSSTIVQIAAYIASVIYNEGFYSTLMIFQAMGVNCGPNIHRFVAEKDEQRITIGDSRALAATREERMRKRQERVKTLEDLLDSEGPQYGPGIDDEL